ncbi:MAG TPA: hypothetical protein VH593_25140, partial [Ktedonobacteraceae bacterium]
TLAGEPLGTLVCPCSEYTPGRPTYKIIAKEFHREIEQDKLYNVAYYKLQNVYTGEIRDALVACYNIVWEGFGE